MRVLVCPHQMVMGGSQINAIELAAGMRERGHEVMLYAPEGELLPKATEAGLDVTVAPVAPSAAWAAGLARLAAAWRAELVHAYEWGPAVGAAFWAHGVHQVPVVVTVLSMDVPRFLPRHLPLLVGTEELALPLAGRRSVGVLEPPVDTSVHHPGDVAGARRGLGIAEGDFVVSIVGRLTDELGKADGVLEAVRACARLASPFPVTLLLAGDGEARERVEATALEVNGTAGRELVRMLGSVASAAAVYDAADVVVGMGSSAIKGLAHGKPVVVQGAAGYVKPVTPDTIGEFLFAGFYGRGATDADLTALLAGLAGDPARRRELGAWGSGLVRDRFSLEAAVRRLEAAYEAALVDPAGTWERVSSLVRSVAGLLKSTVHRWLAADRIPA